MNLQLDFFADDKTEIDYLKEDVKNIRESGDKVRKSLFARHAELAKMYLDMHERMQILEKNICHGMK